MNNCRNDFRYSALDHYLRHLFDWERVYLWDAYCEKSNNTEYYLFDIKDLDNIFGRVYVTEFMQKIDSDFDFSMDYFYFNGQGKDCTTDNPDTVITYSDMVQYILENQETFGDEGIKLILNEK